jgi:hypothetical protein
VRADGTTSAPDACICLRVGRRPRPEQNRALLIRMTHLYLCEGMSTYRIAQLTGLDRQRVARLLRKAGVPLRPYGAGGIQAVRRRGDPPNLAEILTDLYVDRHLTIAQVGALLGIPTGTVRNRLRRYGIRVRTQGQWEREGRQVIPADVLWDLYGRDGLPADDVGRRLGTSRKVVLRNAHDLGVPVRTGGSVPRSGRSEIELVNALYADELVDAVLAQHKIPRVQPGSPIWQRFPDPVPLTRQLVEDLYWRCGLGLNHIELLTGRPAQTIGSLMRRCGITRRHPGGLSPFLRRWRTGSPGDAHLPPGSTRPNPRIGPMPLSRPSQSERGPTTKKGADR